MIWAEDRSYSWELKQRSKKHSVRAATGQVEFSPGERRLKWGRDIVSELEKKGIIVLAKGRSTVFEEMPEAYKEVEEVVNVVHNAGIARKVARLRPIGVVKG